MIRYLSSAGAINGDFIREGAWGIETLIKITVNSQRYYIPV